MTEGNSGPFGNTAQTGTSVSLEAPELERGKCSPFSWGQDSLLNTQRNMNTKYKWAKELGLLFI